MVIASPPRAATRKSSKATVYVSLAVRCDDRDRAKQAASCHDCSWPHHAFSSFDSRPRADL